MLQGDKETKLDKKPADKVGLLTMCKNLEKKEDGRWVIFYSFSQGRTGGGNIKSCGETLVTDCRE